MIATNLSLAVQCVEITMAFLKTDPLKMMSSKYLIAIHTHTCCIVEAADNGDHFFVLTVSCADQNGNGFVFFQ